MLQVEDLNVRLSRHGESVHAVRDVTFSVAQGETLGLVGESGSGKTVTVMAVMRLLDPKAARLDGRVLFDGRDLLTLSESEMRTVRGGQIGIVFQDPMTSLNPVLSVERQLTESLQLHENLTRRQAKVRAIEALDVVGIADPAARVLDYPHQFSGGMRQRVLIAMAIACRPKLLIADEATTALDVTIQAQIVELIGQLRSELGMAVVMISHDLGVVAGSCGRAQVMYGGRIVETGTVDEILDDPRHPYTAGLLESIPRLDRPAGTPLKPIPGQPPDLRAELRGCAFAERCSRAMQRCTTDTPALENVSHSHSKSCWLGYELQGGVSA